MKTVALTLAAALAAMIPAIALDAQGGAAARVSARSAPDGPKQAAPAQENPADAPPPAPPVDLPTADEQPDAAPTGGEASEPDEANPEPPQQPSEGDGQAPAAADAAGPAEPERTTPAPHGSARSGPTRPGTVDLAPSPRARPAADQSLNPVAAVDLESLRDFRSRPLFSPTRQPPPPPAPEAVEAGPQEPAPVSQPNLRLTGVLKGPDESVAIVENLGTNTKEQLRLGDRIDGWLVTAIEPVALRVTLGDREEEYRLFSAPQK